MAKSQAASLRCTVCDLRWPVGAEFQRCPHCDVSTARDYLRAPDAPAFEVNRARFEKTFYPEWERQRVAENEPSPEARGIADATRIAVERMLARERQAA